jgi:hypothetical protein
MQKLSFYAVIGFKAGIIPRLISLTLCEDYSAGGINLPESTRHVKIIE